METIYTPYWFILLSILFMLFIFLAGLCVYRVYQLIYTNRVGIIARIVFSQDLTIFPDPFNSGNLLYFLFSEAVSSQIIQTLPGIALQIRKYAKKFR